LSGTATARQSNNRTQARDWHPSSSVTRCAHLASLSSLHTPIILQGLPSANTPSALFATFAVRIPTAIPTHHNHTTNNTTPLIRICRQGKHSSSKCRAFAHRHGATRSTLAQPEVCSCPAAVSHSGERHSIAYMLALGATEERWCVATGASLGPAWIHRNG
jgi:hypothetical protein